MDVSAWRRQLQRAKRSVDAAALAPEGWVGSCVRAVRAGWGGCLERVGKAGGAYERQGMTEVRLTDAILSAMTKALASRDVEAGKASGKSAAGKAGALVVPSAAAAGAVTTDLSSPPPLAPTTSPMQKAEEKGMSTGVYDGSGTCRRLGYIGIRLGGPAQAPAAPVRQSVGACAASDLAARRYVGLMASDASDRLGSHRNASDRL